MKVSRHAKIRCHTMRVQSPSVNFLVAIILLLASPFLRAQDGVQGAFEQAGHTGFARLRLEPIHGSTLAVADFDGDNKLDGAVILETGPFLASTSFQIDLHFTDRRNQNISFESSESDITVAALDIDRDGDFDIVIEQSLTHKRLQIWLNDGHGNFEKGRVEDFPPAAAPTGEHLASSQRADGPVLSLATQRTFETTLIASHIAGRPPSEVGVAALFPTFVKTDSSFSLATSRAPPLS